MNVEQMFFQGEIESWITGSGSVNVEVGHRISKPDSIEIKHDIVHFPEKRAVK